MKKDGVRDMSLYETAREFDWEIHRKRRMKGKPQETQECEGRPRKEPIYQERVEWR
jgi:hypothetical protein